MPVDYRPMWKDQGLDLDAHDALLAVLGPPYADTFMGQNNRPEAMQYFDFVMSGIHGLRVKELMDARESGRKVFGPFRVFVPEEIVLAVEGILVGLCAEAEFAVDEAEKLLPRNTCALIKGAFGFALAKVCPYLAAADVVVSMNNCVEGRDEMKIDDGLLLMCKSSGIGDGEPDLGEKLMRSFLTMLIEKGRLPAKCLFLNSGIFLTTRGSPVLDLLEKLEQAGSKILSCGTCLDYYQRKDALEIGQPTDMRATVDAMLEFDRVVVP